MSNPNGRAVRLRITCDTKYPNIISDIFNSIHKILPTNKVSVIKRAEEYHDISCYSNQWENILGWKAGNGSKFQQKVFVPQWIKNNLHYSKQCLKGLIQTDGSIYYDRGYKMVNFVTIIPTLAQDVVEMINNLGFKCHSYMIATKTKTRYNIRISTNAQKFINKIKLIK